MAEQSVYGKVVAITGAARGIGLATAKRLLDEGAKIGGGDLDLALLEEELGKLGGTNAAFELDVTDRDSFADFIAGVEEQLGPIDILINNAGVMSLSPFLDESDEAADRMLDINVKGPMHGARLVLPGMLARGRGHIITIASTAGRFGIPGAAMYSASKFGAYGLTEALAAEYRDTPVNFSAICPVIVNTELVKGVTGSTRGVPMLEPEDVAEAIAGTIHKPRVLVYVPRNIRLTYLLTVLLPTRARAAIEHFVRSDRVMLEIDRDARAAYDERAFRSKTPH